MATLEFPDWACCAFLVGTLGACSPTDARTVGTASDAGGAVPRALAELPVIDAADSAWHLASTILWPEAAVATTDGWIVLDGQGNALHYLARDGSWIRSVGRRGDGPGELDGPRFLASDGQAVWVAASAERVDRFHLDGTFDGRLSLTLDDCLAPRLQGLAGGRPPLAVLRCDHGRRATFQVVSFDEDGATRVLDRRKASIDGSLDLTTSVVAAGPDGPIWGITSDPCFGAPGGAAITCFARDSFPIGDDLRRELEDGAAAAARAAGIRFRVPDVYPFVTDVTWVEGGWIANRPVSEELGFFELWPTAERRVVRENTLAWIGPDVILLARTELGGTSLAVVPLPDALRPPEG